MNDTFAHGNYRGLRRLRSGADRIYPRYFDWFDRATERMFRSRGLPWAQLFPRYRMAGVALVDASASFRGASRFGDRITLETWVGGVAQQGVRGRAPDT